MNYMGFGWLDFDQLSIFDQDQLVCSRCRRDNVRGMYHSQFAAGQRDFWSFCDCSILSTCR